MEYKAPTKPDAPVKPDTPASPKDAPASTTPDDGTVTIIPSEQKGDGISFKTDNLSDYGIIGTPVNTTAKHKTASNMMVWLYIILAIVLLLIIFVVWKRRKDKNQRTE